MSTVEDDSGKSDRSPSIVFTSAAEDAPVMSA